MTDAKRPDNADELPADDAEATAASDPEATPTEHEPFTAEVDGELVKAGDADEGAQFADEVDDVDFDHEPAAISVADEPVLAADEAAPTRPMSSRERRAAKVAGKTAPVAGPDDLPYVDDRVSKWWVGLIAAVFALILVYGFLLGRGGLLTTPPTPVPSEPAESVLITQSPAASATPRLSVSPAASGTAAPLLSAAPTSSGGTSPAASSAASPAASSAPSASPGASST